MYYRAYIIVTVPQKLWTNLLSIWFCFIRVRSLSLSQRESLFIDKSSAWKFENIFWRDFNLRWLWMLWILPVMVVSFIFADLRQWVKIDFHADAVKLFQLLRIYKKCRPTFLTYILKFLVWFTRILYL